MISKIRKIYSRWAEFLRLAWDSLLAHRLRSFLTIVGVIIGVAVVATVASLLEGAGNFVNAQIATFAPDVVRVEKVSFLDFGGDGQEFAEASSKRPDLLPEDIEFLKNRFEGQIEIGGGERQLDTPGQIPGKDFKRNLYTGCNLEHNRADKCKSSDRARVYRKR